MTAPTNAAKAVFAKSFRLFDYFLSAALQKLFFDTNNRRRINKYITVLTPPAAI